MTVLTRTFDRACRVLPRWLLVVFGLGALVRALLIAAYSPAALQNGDLVSYVTMAPFTDSRQASGIHLFIEPFEWIGSLTLLVAAQHLLGVVTAVLVAAAVRRLDGGWLVTGAASGLTLFGSNALYLEHAVLTETLFTTVVAAALLATLYVDGSSGWRPALAAGSLAGASLCTRSVGAAVVVLTTVAVLLLAPGSARAKLGLTAVTVAGALAIVAIYMAGVALTRDGQSGIGQWGGWYTYARAAAFADCDRFDPPAGTEVLCEETDPEQRPGPSWYMFDPDSPARIHFRQPPAHSELMRSFGLAAIRSDPAAYAQVVLRDLLRYFDDDLGREQERSGGGYATVALDRRDFISERFVADRLSGSGFGKVSTPTVRAAGVLEIYATVFEVDGRVVLVLLALSLAGVVLSTGRATIGTTLYLAVGVALLAIPVLTIIYNARYAIPAAVLLAVPAAIGAQAIGDRLLGGAGPGRRLSADESTASPTAPAR